MEDLYYFYSRRDTDKQPITTIGAPSRYQAALFFAKLKRLSLKDFLEIYAVSR